jgi:two-component system, chemotaxis family, protein-glutamate methylesterase/glutaminase
MKRVLIADDSALVRKHLRKIIETLGYEIETARNGKEAVEKVMNGNFNVVTMDINMPVLDGLSAVKRIMQDKPTPILMISSLTTESAGVTIEALELGAVDFISKPGTMNVGAEENRENILQKIKLLSRIPARRLKQRVQRPLRREPETQKTIVNNRDSRDITKVLLIGASTGGPGLIEDICSSLPLSFPHPVCIVQHMPEKFTEAFATRLNRVSVLSVHESRNNMELIPGNIYVARGGMHLHFAKKVSGKIVLREEATKGEQFFQPSVNEMFKSALNVFGGSQLMAVLLTGIGDDGADSMVDIKKAGGYTIGESEESATVYGMPKEAYERGGVCEQLPFTKIIKAIVNFK